MKVFSSKGPFLFLVIISCSALLSQSSIFAKELSQTFSTEITKNNCKNNRTFLSECPFNISFQPPLKEKLECFLTFPTDTNYSVRFSSDQFELQRQIGQMCPQFGVEIKTQEKNPRKLFTTCGGTVNPVLKTFYNFTLAYIHYDNKGLIDNSTTIKMQLRLETDKPCDNLKSKTFDVKDHLSWIIILSVVGCVVLIFVCAVIVYRYRFKGNERKAPNSPSPEEKKPFCESVDGGNGKLDLEDDSKGQDSTFCVPFDRYISWTQFNLRRVKAKKVSSER